jgi:acetyltransferase
MLALSTASAVRRAYATIVDNIERAAPQARLDGILVAEMLGEGLDLRCGAMRLQSGDTVLYGQPQGGPIGTEPALALSPLSPSGARLLAHAVVSRIVVPALRRHSDPDVLGLAQLFLRLDAIFQTLGSRIARVDLSPVRLVGPPRGYVTLDARILQEPHLEGL